MSALAHDFHGTGDAALAQIESVLAHWLPGGRYTGSEYKVRNPTRDDHKPGSFSINVTNGRWADFATDDRGGDLVSLVAYLDGVTQSEAERRLAEFLSRRAESGGNTGNACNSIRNIPEIQGTSASDVVTPRPMPTGNTGNQPEFSHPKLGEAAAVWTYHNPDGLPWFHVCRFESSDDKVILPRSWDGTAWQWKAVQPPRPLYNLHHLQDRPHAPVVLTEGEKAADAAAKLFSECVTTTTPNGSKAPAKADLSPLAGRTVYIWPDNDEPGQAYAETVAGLAHKAGAARVFILDLDKLGLPDKGDAADVALDPNEAAVLLTDARPWREPDSLPEDFSLDDKGVYYHGTDKEGHPLAPVWVCSPLRIRAMTRDANGNAWGALLEFEDQDGRPHRWPMPFQLLAGDGNEYRRELLGQGLRIASGHHARQRLTEYIQTSRTKARARCVKKTGWHENVFVLPDETLGETSELVVWQSLHEPAAMQCAGTVEDWRDNVAALCNGNSRLILAVSAAFAAPLLDITGDDSGGVNLQGPSSTGKTTGLQAACSVWGGPDYLQRWRATTNGLEARAVVHNDALLCLDELAQVDAREAGNAAYLLANGSGNLRARRDGLAKPKATWRLLFLSAGEIGLAQHMLEAGKKARAGQEVRLADVPAEVRHGMFEQLHGRPNGGALADAIRDTARTYYGAPAREYLKKLVEKDRDKLRERVRKLRAEFTGDFLPEGAEGQAQRVCDRFALIAAGGELATLMNLTGWQPGAASAAAGLCFQAWLDHRGGAGSQETKQALEQVALFFERHGSSRFAPWKQEDNEVGEDNGNDRKRVTYNRAGFRRTVSGTRTEYYVFAQVWSKQVCEGYDPRWVARLCVERGLIIPDKHGRPYQQGRLPELGSQKYYHFVRTTVDEDAD